MKAINGKHTAPCCSETLRIEPGRDFGHCLASRIPPENLSYKGGCIRIDLISFGIGIDLVTYHSCTAV